MRNKRFPNIVIDTENLHKEWKKHAFLDFSELNISPDMPVEEYWTKILKMTDETVEPMFPNLKEVIMVLLILPFSNACVERVFSQLKLIKSDHRNRLNTNTIAALMATKAAIKNATTFEPSKALMHARIKYSKDGDDDGEGWFYEECGIPGVIGCIDCTHVAIIKPSNHEERFFNRKHYHSLNVQIICDSDLQILSVDASHPGATNDCIIWQMHPLYEYLRNCRQNGETLWMLGDSGYPQRNILMTPILNALREQRKEYTQICICLLEIV
ncbi:Putative nuclease HARBI1 [Eumeta japonica]|uniref:Nuclease HARBI1 n=1 Tax=Eumeta variegata TaxID=151549 RepID=A0A4C1VWB7_EUMVA|nr:Putative nuclease HARBI1 [Eumeta japonica]